MRRSSTFRSAVFASTLAVVCSIACKQEDPQIPAVDYPGAMAEGYCTAVYSCMCSDYPYPNVNECFADLVEAYDIVNDQAFLAGLAYDGTCPAKELDSIEALACKGYVPPAPEGVCYAPCNVWHGNLPGGYPCEVIATSAELGLAFSNCGQGLVCQAGVCTNPCQGGALLPGVGQPCPGMVCATGAVCDEATMTCVAAPTLPGPGQPCPDGVCSETAACVVGTCVALPAAGQPCLDGLCDANSYCGGDNFCLTKEALACYLLGGGAPGDGDGDPTGDGDGDPTGDGDGDGDGAPGCEATALESSVPTAWVGDTTSGVNTYAGTCGGDGGPEDVLSYVAPQDGLYELSLEGSPFDTVLYVRDGSCDGAELTCDNDSVIPPASLVEVSLTTGQEIFIFVDGFEGGGTYVLNINMI